MKLRMPTRLFGIILFILAVALSGRAALSETFVGSNVDSRILVGFDVNASGVQSLLPGGWSPVPFPAGPLKGANIMVVLIDRAMQLDPEGKPTSPSSSRHAVLAGLGKQDGGDAVRLYVYRIYATDPDPNPYGNSVMADVSRAASESGPANGGRQSTEVWTATPQDGGEMKISLSYTTAQRSWSSSVANPYSNTIPEFSRIYRYEQLVDVAMSVPIGKQLAGEFSFSNSIPELAEIFNGSEKVVAILDVPVYVRKVFLP